MTSMPDTTVAHRGLPRGLRLGRLLGAPIVLDWSWFFAAGIITAVFTPWVLTMRPDLGGTAVAVAFCYAVLLFASVFLHEVAHGVAARAYGSTVVSIVLNVWGGYTDTLPGRPKESPQAATQGIVIAVVGPVVNFVLAGVGWIALQATQAGSIAWLLLVAVTFANVALGTVNILPGIPLDGGRALQHLIWRLTGSLSKGTVIACWLGYGFIVVLLAVVVLPPLLKGQLPDIIVLVWTVSIAAVLWFYIHKELRVARLQRRIETYDLSRLVQPAIAADRLTSIAEAIRSAEREDGSALIIVVDSQGIPMGIVDRSAARRIPVEQWNDVTLDQVSRVLGPWIGVPEDITAVHLVEELQLRDSTAFVLLLRGNTLVGLLDVQELSDDILHPG